MLVAVIGRNQKGMTLSHNETTAAGGYAARFLCMLGYFSNQRALNKSEPFLMRRFLFCLLYSGAENLAPSTKMTLFYFFISSSSRGGCFGFNSL